MQRVAPNPHKPQPQAPQTETRTRTRFIVDGEVYVPARDAARVILLAGDLSPSGAYAALTRAARQGRVRTAPASPRTRWYHHADVLALADQARSA